MAENEREVHAQIILTWYADGQLDASWPDNEMVTRYMLSKAEDAYNRLIYQRAMIEHAKGIHVAPADAIKRLGNGRPRG